MWVISAAAVSAARIWWVLRYWSPRAADLRRRDRSLELGIEHQLALELPVDDPWRQQVDPEVAAHPDPVPMTAALVQASLDARVRGGRRWRRQLRAIRRAHLPSTAVVPRAAPSPARRVRRAVVPIVSVAAALSLGYNVGGAGHHPTPAPPVAGIVSAHNAHWAAIPIDRISRPHQTRPLPDDAGQPDRTSHK